MPNYRQDRLRVSTGVEHARGDTTSAQGPRAAAGHGTAAASCACKALRLSTKAADVDGLPRRSPRGVTASGR
jgi:hypothetical protein